MLGGKQAGKAMTSDRIEERAKDEAAIAEALRLITAADDRVIASLIRGVDTIDAERLIQKMQLLVEEMRQTMVRSDHAPRS
jgi:hypothetical protein